MKEYTGSNMLEESFFAIVVAEFNKEITENLLQGVLRALEEKGIDSDGIVIARVPGAYELPCTAQCLAHTDKFDAIICLGAIIRGETAHFDYVAKEAARGIMNVSLQADIPVLFGVLTTENRAQAEARSEPNGKNKGYEMGLAAVQMANLHREMIADELEEFVTTGSFLN